VGGVERRGGDGELGGREEGEGGGYCVDKGGEEKRGYFCCRGRVLVGLGESFLDESVGCEATRGERERNGPWGVYIWIVFCCGCGSGESRVGSEGEVEGVSLGGGGVALSYSSVPASPASFSTASPPRSCMATGSGTSLFPPISHK